MDMFDNYPSPEGYIPDNREVPFENYGLTIMAGETASHSFDIPFDVNEDCNGVEIIYKLGLTVVLTKIPNSGNIAVIRDDSGEFCYTNITVVLSEEETLLFKDTLLDAFVQLKFIMKDNSIQYSEICPITIEDALDVTTE